MLETEFEIFLMSDESIKSKEKAVSSRMSKARVIEKRLGRSLELIVLSDNDMHNALCAINLNINNRNGAYSNALRKYYTFCTGKAFPKIAEFKSEK